MKAIELNVVVFIEHELWVAQCLEHDVSARAKTVKDLSRRLERTLTATLIINRKMGRTGLDGIKPAPQRFHDLFEQSDFDLRPRHERSAPAPLHFRGVRLAEPKAEAA